MKASFKNFLKLNQIIYLFFIIFFMTTNNPLAYSGSIFYEPIRFTNISDLLTYYASRITAHGWWNLKTARGCTSYIIVI